MTLRTNRLLAVTSSPACSPQYTIIVPQTAEVIAVHSESGTRYALDRPQDYGANAHDATHYYFFVPANAVSEDMT